MIYTHTIMKKLSILLTFALVLLVAACSPSSKFTVEGKVSGAADKMIYLEASKLQGLVVLDSMKLNTKGLFTFESKQPESPEFYRLRIDNKVINFSIDSTEVLEFQADYDAFMTKYEVKGSENAQRIKEITLKQYELQNQVDLLLGKTRKGEISNKGLQESLKDLFTAYKEEIKSNYIFVAPNTTAAYYALFPKINGYMLFDPLNSREDLRCFAAVATSLNENYPHADRSKNLYNIVIKGMKNTRQPKEQSMTLPDEKINVTGLIDIELRDIQGKIRKLTDLKGKVVLLDFTVYQSPVSAAHIFTLRDLYKKYKNEGLEIYQVSLDADEHFWKTAVDNLPWICVRDGHGIYSNYASIYNVKEVPSFFLINRENELVIRGEQVKDIEKSVKTLL